MVQYPRLEFPIEERHHRAGIELAVPGCFQYLHFIDNSGFLINDQTINSLALISEILLFHRILGIRRRDSVVFELVVNRDDVGGASRRDEREL